MKKSDAWRPEGYLPHVGGRGAESFCVVDGFSLSVLLNDPKLKGSESGQESKEDGKDLAVAQPFL